MTRKIRALCARKFLMTAIPMECAMRFSHLVAGGARALLARPDGTLAK
jgi:hypothetical protein